MENNSTLWKSILQKFEQFFYIDLKKDDFVSSFETKDKPAGGYCPITGMRKQFAQEVPMKDAVASFLNALTDEEKSIIRISTQKEEYVDAESHDTNKHYTEIKVKSIKPTKPLS